jgi:hypothetical protein
MTGPLHRFFSADHGRLDVLLRRSIADPGRVDLVPFGEFRAGILRHIGMEETYLFVIAKAARGAARHIEEALALSRRQWEADGEGRR